MFSIHFEKANSRDIFLVLIYILNDFPQNFQPSWSGGEGWGHLQVKMCCLKHKSERGLMK